MTFKLGLIGPGGIANSKLAPAIKEVEGAELWSVMSRDLERARDFATRHGACSPVPAHDDLDVMLADKSLDGVIIATPDKLHAEQTIAAARAGKHVLVEKPVATDLASARDMAEICAAEGRTLAVAYHLRHHAGLQQVHERVRAGEFGRIHHLRMQWTFHVGDASNWRASTDVGRWWGLGGVGTHSLDQVLWMVGPQNAQVEEVKGVVSNDVYRGPHDETAVVAVRFAGGTLAEITSSVLFAAPSRFELYGERGRVIGEDVLGTSGGGQLWINGEPLQFPEVNPYAGEISDFVHAATTGRAPAVGADEAIKNIEILLAAAPVSK